MIASDSTVGPEVTRVTEVGGLARNGTGDVGRNNNKRKNYNNRNRVLARDGTGDVGRNNNNNNKKKKNKNNKKKKEY
jgi:hypothetical protein